MIDPRRLFRSAFVRRASTLSAGSMVGVLVGLAGSPVVSRLYTPEAFGVFGVYMAVLTVVIAGSTLKFEWALVVAEDDTEAAALFRLGNLAGLLISVVAAAAVVPLWWAGALPSLWLVLPVAVVAHNLVTTLEHRANRAERYGLMSQSRVTQSVVNTGTRIGAAWTPLHPVGLALSEVLAFAAGALTLWTRTPRAGPAAPLGRTAARHRRFPCFSAPASVLNATATRIEYLLFLAFFPAGLLGAYYFWSRLIDIPKTLIASSIWQILLRETRGMDRAGIARRKEPRQRALVDLTIAPWLAGALLVPVLVGPVFGERWAPYGPIAIPLAVAGHINLCVSGFSLFVPLGEQRKELLFNAALGAVKAGAALVGWAVFRQAETVVWVVAGAHGLAFLLLGDWYHHMLGRGWGRFSSLYLRAVVRSAAPPVAAVAAALWADAHWGVALAVFFVAAGGASAYAARRHIGSASSTRP